MVKPERPIRHRNLRQRVGKGVEERQFVTKVRPEVEVSISIDDLLPELMPLLMLGIETGQAKGVLDALKILGFEPIVSSCCNCGMRFINGWLQRRNGYLEVVSFKQITPGPCLKTTDGRHEVKGM